MNNQTSVCPECGAQYDPAIGLICCPACAAVLPGGTVVASPASSAPTAQYSVPRYSAPQYSSPSYSAPQYGTSAPVSDVTCGLCGAAFPSNLAACPACGNLMARAASVPAADISGERTVAVAASGTYPAPAVPPASAASVPAAPAPAPTAPAQAAPLNTAPSYAVPAYTPKAQEKPGLGAKKGLAIFFIALAAFSVIFLSFFCIKNCSRMTSPSSSASHHSVFSVGKKPSALRGDDKLAYDMLVDQIDFFPKPETVRMVGGSLGVDKDCLFCYLQFVDEDGETVKDYYYIDASGFILHEDQPYDFYSDTEELDIDAINAYLEYELGR